MVTGAMTRRGCGAKSLRRMGIRDFIDLSENSWDFNAPSGAPGFDSLTTGDTRRPLLEETESFDPQRLAAEHMIKSRHRKRRFSRLRRLYANRWWPMRSACAVYRSSRFYRRAATGCISSHRSRRWRACELPIHPSKRHCCRRRQIARRCRAATGCCHTSDAPMARAILAISASLISNRPKRS